LQRRLQSSKPFTIKDKDLDKHRIQHAQNIIEEQKLDGWLLYDFRRNNSLACRFLGISDHTHLTRRFLYYIPKKGDPVKIVHAVESFVLDHLPGMKKIFTTWNKLEELIRSLFRGGEKIAMEYSPRNAIPYVSKVDAGTLDLMQSFGVHVVTSAGLLQRFNAVLSEEQVKSHLFACEFLDVLTNEVFQYVSSRVQQGSELTEYQVQSWILEKFEQNHCVTDSPPIVAINGFTSNPHYMPTKERSNRIEAGDFLLIDLWCRQENEGAIFGDITRVAVLRDEPTTLENELFHLVREAQKKAVVFLEKRIKNGEIVRGFEVDDVAREFIRQGGRGDNFIHRLGHSIYTETHGEGANLDNYETHDDRQLLPNTCFSIEPGIYLKGQLGLRLEHDVLLQENLVRVTGGTQEEIYCLL
jgi:Xaa-Pro dipeptidase